MRSVCAVTAANFLSLAAGSLPVTAQEAPLLEPRLTFEVASVLGLKLERGRGLVEVVIDRLQMPTEN